MSIIMENMKNEKVNSTEEARNGDWVSENEGKSRKLHESFVDEEDNKSVESRNSTPLTMKDHTVYKEFSPKMVMFVSNLYNEGYFKDSNLFLRKWLDITCFENIYTHNFVNSLETYNVPDNREEKNEKSNIKEEARNGDWVLENEGKGRKLYEFFVDEEDNKSVKSRKSMPLTMEDHTVYKELSLDITMFLSHLYNEGYFKIFIFLHRKRIDITLFENSYPRVFVKYAAEQFGKHH
ncbi:hypothetical protein HAX54_047197 [Datura stramonium]|uniref:Uncharacterized protein n=1 Tax=Datura stramonium TaxID=4076 RepID=A0ABS8WLV7_DATST|nr:hypothetical protein [Datura stramonium]